MGASLLWWPPVGAAAGTSAALRHAIDAEGAVSEPYGVQFIPTTYLIDREGRMMGRTAGPNAWDSDTATELLMSLINQPQG